MISDFLWAAATVPLAYLSCLVSPVLFALVGLLAFFSLNRSGAASAMLGAAMGATFAFATGISIGFGLAIGAAVGSFLPLHFTSAEPARYLRMGAGVLGGLGALMLGPYLSIEWVSGWMASLAVAASHYGRRGFLAAMVLVAGFSTNLISEYTRPRTFLFYQQVHASALDLFSRFPVDSTTFGVEAFRGPRGRIYVGSAESWISDGGRYIENPALSPMSFALRWQKLSGSNEPLQFGGIVTPELCERFPGKPLRFLKSDLTFFADPCPLSAAGNLEEARHLMLFEPIDTEVVSKDAVSFPDGIWTRWRCAVQSIVQGRNFLKRVTSEGPAKVYQLSFRSAECLVRAGPAMSEPEAMERDPILARFLALEGAI